jgi:hypothetical protein
VLLEARGSHGCTGGAKPSAGGQRPTVELFQESATQRLDQLARPVDPGCGSGLSDVSVARQAPWRTTTKWAKPPSGGLGAVVTGCS